MLLELSVFLRILSKTSSIPTRKCRFTTSIHEITLQDVKAKEILLVHHLWPSTQISIQIQIHDFLNESSFYHSVSVHAEVCRSDTMFCGTSPEPVLSLQRSYFLSAGANIL